MDYRTYRVFIGHSWARNPYYHGLVGLMNGYERFRWKNVSVPMFEPSLDPASPKDRARLLGLIESAIAGADCTIFIPGTRPQYMEWIEAEADIAKRLSKPVVVVLPRGTAEAPESLKAAASEVVGWSAPSVVAAVRNAAGD